MPVSCLVGDGNGTWVLWKSSQCSKTLSHCSSLQSTFPVILFRSRVCVCVCVSHTYTTGHGSCVKPENNLPELALTFYSVGFMDWTQVLSLGGKCLTHWNISWSHFTYVSVELFVSELCRLYYYKQIFSKNINTSTPELSNPDNFTSM